MTDHLRYIEHAWIYEMNDSHCHCPNQYPDLLLRPLTRVIRLVVLITDTAAECCVRVGHDLTGAQRCSV